MRKKTIIVLLQLCFFFLCTPSGYSEDVFLTIGSGSGPPGSRNVPITVTLDNGANRILGVNFKICDRNNYLKVTECEAVGRASELNCQYGEKLGCAEIGLFGMRDAIQEGSGPILKFYYDVSTKAPPGESIDLKPKGVIVAPDTRSMQQGRNKYDSVSTLAEKGSFFITDTGEDDDEDETTTTSTTDSSDTATEENETDITSKQGTAASQLASATNRRNKSGGTSQLTYGSPRRATPATGAPLDTSDDRQVSTRRTTAARQEGTRSNPSETTTVVPDSSLSGPRIIVSPESLTLTSGDLIALAPQTTTDGIPVDGNYSYKITPPSSIGSMISDDGLFTAGTNTSSSNIEETIKVIDTANKGATAFVLITIEGRKQLSSKCELFISPSSATLSSENTMQFRAYNSEERCREGLFTWKVNSKIGSSINEQGVFKAGNNTSIDPALDIIIVTDTLNEVSSDVIVTVLPGVETETGVSSAPLNPKLTGISGKTTYPTILILLTIITIVIGIIIFRKGKH